MTEPMLIYCQMDPEEQTSMKFESKHNTFLYPENVFEKVDFMYAKCSLFNSGLNVLTQVKIYHNDNFQCSPGHRKIA